MVEVVDEYVGVCEVSEVEVLVLLCVYDYVYEYLYGYFYVYYVVSLGG